MNTLRIESAEQRIDRLEEQVRLLAQIVEKLVTLHPEAQEPVSLTAQQVRDGLGISLRSDLNPRDTDPDWPKCWCCKTRLLPINSPKDDRMICYDTACGEFGKPILTTYFSDSEFDQSMSMRPLNPEAQMAQDILSVVLNPEHQGMTSYMPDDDDLGPF